MPIINATECHAMPVNARVCRGKIIEKYYLSYTGQIVFKRENGVQHGETGIPP